MWQIYWTGWRDDNRRFFGHHGVGWSGGQTGGCVICTKPYAASGRYINRMSNYRSGCSYDPTKPTGPDACPFTTFYWDFLVRNKRRFANNPRMTMMLLNLDSLASDEKRQITKRAGQLRAELAVSA